MSAAKQAQHGKCRGDVIFSKAPKFWRSPPDSSASAFVIGRVPDGRVPRARCHPEPDRRADESREPEEDSQGGPGQFADYNTGVAVRSTRSANAPRTAPQNAPVRLRPSVTLRTRQSETFIRRRGQRGGALAGCYLTAVKLPVRSTVVVPDSARSVSTPDIELPFSEPAL